MGVNLIHMCVHIFPIIKDYSVDRFVYYNKNDNYSVEKEGVTYWIVITKFYMKTMKRVSSLKAHNIIDIQ